MTFGIYEIFIYSFIQIFLFRTQKHRRVTENTNVYFDILIIHFIKVICCFFLTFMVVLVMTIMVLNYMNLYNSFSY